MGKEVLVLGLDAVKFLAYLRRLESQRFHGTIEIKVYDGEVKQVKVTRSEDLRKLWPDREVDDGDRSA